MTPISTDPSSTPKPEPPQSPSEGSPVKRPHLPFLDGIRALAALEVAFYHLRIFQGSGEYLGRFGRVLTNWMMYGHFAVGVFIVLSGFCLMLPVAFRAGQLPHPALVFFKRRAHRILPPYYFALLLSLAVIGLGLGKPESAFSSALPSTLWDSSLPVTGLSLAAHLLLVQNFVGGYMRINPILWSIAVEWQIYFLFPLLVILFRRIGALRTMLAATLVSVYGIWVVHHLTVISPAQHLMPQYLGLFVMGMYGASLTFGSPDGSGLRHRLPWGVLTVLTVVVIFAARVLLGVQNFMNADLDYIDVLIGFATCFLLIHLSLTPQSLLRRALDFPPLVALGLFSYSLYLIHLPIMQLFWQYGLVPHGLNRTPGLLLLIFPGVPLCVLAAYLFHLVAERPFMNSKAQKSLRLALKDSDLAPEQ